MKLKFSAAVIAALLLAPAAMPASAQVYINVAYGDFSFNNPDRSPGALTGRVGYDVNRYFAVEGEGSFGIIKDNSIYELNSEFGAFVLGKLPLYEDKFHVYGRIGYTTIDETDFEDDGFAFGIGGQYNWGKHGMRLDWTRHDHDAGEVDSFSLGYAYTF